MQKDEEFDSRLRSLNPGYVYQEDFMVLAQVCNHMEQL